MILRTDTEGAGKEYRGYHLFERRLFDIVPGHGICRTSFHSDDMIQFSPDGESALLLCAPLQSGEEGANLYLIHSVTEQVIPIFGRRVVDVRWSPDGSQWLLSVGRQLEIYDTDDLSLIQSVIYDSGSSGFEWSPDGTHIAYTVFGVGLVLYDVVNGMENVIAIERIGGPQWSPDGSKIAAIVRYPVEDGQLIIVDVASGESTVIDEIDGHRFGFVSGFYWSPVDNRLIAFTELFDNDYTKDFHVINDDFTAVDAMNTTWLQWSPDGRYLVNTTMSYAHTQLTFRDTWANNELVMQHRDTEWAQWASDSMMAAFIQLNPYIGSSTEARYQLYSWRQGDSHPRRLIHDKGYHIHSFAFVRQR